MLLHAKERASETERVFLCRAHDGSKKKGGEGSGDRSGNLSPIEVTGGWAYGGTTPPVP